jgi:hypothetical protein
MKNLINIIKDYMSDKFNIDLSLSDTEENTRKIFLTVMTDVNNMSQNQDKSLQDTNIQVLAKVKDYYCSKLNLTNTGANLKKPNIQNLTREQTIYGDRPLKQNIIIPIEHGYHGVNDRFCIAIPFNAIQYGKAFLKLKKYSQQKSIISEVYMKDFLKNIGLNIIYSPIKTQLIRC